jgi:putative transposase
MFNKRVCGVYCALRLNLPRAARTGASRPAARGAGAAQRDVGTRFHGRCGVREPPLPDPQCDRGGNCEALAIEGGTSISSARLIRVLDDLIRLYGRLARVRIDNGPELTAEAFAEWCAAPGIAIGYI